MSRKNGRIIGPNEKYARWDMDDVDFERMISSKVESRLFAVREELKKQYKPENPLPDQLKLDINCKDIKLFIKQLEDIANYYDEQYKNIRRTVNQQYRNSEISGRTYQRLRKRYLKCRDLAKTYRYYAKKLKPLHDSEQSLHKYVASVTRQLANVPYAEDLLQILPGETAIPIAARKINVDQEHIQLSTHQREKIRLALINSRIVNWKWMVYQTHDDKLKNATPYFLNALGKVFFNARYKKSPDSVAKSLYQNRAIQNKTFSIQHIPLLANFYRSAGYHVEEGQYPFDLVIDGKHGFVCTEFHENSIGIEMRLSEAMYQCEQQDMVLYLPAMNGEHRRRISAIMAGLYFEGKIELYTYVTYLESQICSNISACNWSYMRTKMRTKSNGDIMSALPDDVLEFPKVDVNNKDFVQNEMLKTEDDEDDKLCFGQAVIA